MPSLAARSLLAVLLSLTSPALAATSTHPFSVQDLIAMDRISDPRPSPDGRTVVFVNSTLDLDHNGRLSALWTVGADGTGLARLTADGDAGNPRWSSDGRDVFFLSRRSGTSQVWRIPLRGGEAEPVTRLPLDVTALAVAPDGGHLVISMRVVPDSGIAGTRRYLDEIARRDSLGPTGRIYDRLFVRHWDEWANGTRSHWPGALL